MSVAAALGTATIYPLQPAIADISRTLGTATAAVGAALACGPIGYMLGLALLVPLVDRFSPRRVLALQFLALAGALALTAAAGKVWLIGLGLLLTGACSSVGAGLSSVVGRLAPEHRRSTSLGIVTAGISAGILFGRIVGGWLTDLIGWHAMLFVVAAAVIGVAGVCLVVLPTAKGAVEHKYLAGLASTPGLLIRNRVLRRGAVRGSLWFFAFCAIWSGIAVALSQEPFLLAANQIGLYALAGISGIFATRIAGGYTDRFGSRPVILVGLAAAGVACPVLAFGLDSVAATMVALAMFDAGLFAAQVANQTTILAIHPSAPARFNSAYMLVYFIGGSLGTAFGAAAVASFNWATCVGACGAALLVAVVLTVAGEEVNSEVTAYFASKKFRRADSSPVMSTTAATSSSDNLPAARPSTSAPSAVSTASSARPSAHSTSMPASDARNWIITPSTESPTATD
ncbi:MULTISPECIES: MFS transporter [unclassified Mycolicibacterium]|uniref:MFS transporter n=1 Tax=unclassified Mycolicibacterium TaxID=2636767 RepID=UPI0028163CBE|nr:MULTISPECIES: MFS transporter [unclassified Mycolicibacterium]